MFKFFQTIETLISNHYTNEKDNTIALAEKKNISFLNKFTLLK
jgi:hypothetical protein